jgi:SAM-dependent methyltransferase
VSAAGARCRSCGGGDLAPVLDLGRMPLANALLREADLAAPEPTFPLELVLCRACGLAQITHTVPPELLFREYLYFSSFSDTMLAHAAALARETIAERGLGHGSLVIEVASNDGYLLRSYVEAGVPVLGVEPARNVARVAEERGVPTIAEFFDPPLARKLTGEGRRASVLHAHNVLAHVADLGGFVEAMRLVLADDGVAIVEVPYVREMVERCEFDTIYHEHLCYFSVGALVRLFASHGLTAVRVKRVPIHGGSLRVHVAKSAAACAPDGSVEAMLDEERRAGLDDVAFYEGFAARVEALRRSLGALLAELCASGRRVAGYGAAAKGAVLLNAFGIGRETIAYVVDRSRHKQGLYLPGVRIPIHAPEKLLEDRPDYVLLLAWNVADEVLAAQRAYREAGGKFIVPLPRVTVL